MAIVPTHSPSQLMQLTAGDFHGIVGRSAPMLLLYALLEKAARADRLPVMIRGASGTGKERLARLIHELGPRRHGPFVVFNCATVSSEVMESELFGHVKGAFTGAHQDQPGLLRRAHGGTLFIDELGAMPKHMQQALLRALDSGEVRSVGSTEVEYLDVRIVTATNQDLEAMIAAGTFQEDTYHRLAGLRLDVPLLAERRDDIPRLSRHFLDALPDGLGVVLGIEALAALTAYEFPGNVRELLLMIGRLHALRENPGVITLAEVEAELQRSREEAKRFVANDLRDELRWLDLEGRTLADAEQEVGKRTLLRCGGNKTAAAKLLGIDRNRLTSILKKAG